MRTIYLTLSWAAGIFLADRLWQYRLLGCHRPTWYIWSLFLLILFLTVYRQWQEKRIAGGLLIFAFFIGGIWRYQLQPFAPCWHADNIAYYAGQLPGKVSLTGLIVGEPDVRDYRIGYRLQAETIKLETEPHHVSGQVLVWGDPFPRYVYGDRVRVQGKLEQPPVFPDFNYRRYLARQGIHAMVRQAEITPITSGHGSAFWRSLFAVKAVARRTVDHLLPEPEAALANGILLGIESGIPRTLYGDFNATGTSHIIVISGFNISIIAGVFLLFFRRLLGKRRAAIPAIIGILLYVLLVGANAAVLRAGLMGIIFIAAILFGRRSTAIISLFASALIMLLLNPLTLWDIGFQLSLTATLGLILLTPTLEARTRLFLAHWLPAAWLDSVMGWLNDAFVVTLAAQIVTTPMIVAYFGRFSLISLLTNFLILPVQPAVMIGGGIALLAGLIWLPLGRLFAVIPWLTLAYTVAVVRWSAHLPHASLVVSATLRQAAAMFYLLFGALFILWLQRTPKPLFPASWGKPLRRAGWATLAFLPILYLGQIGWAAHPDGHLHLYALPDNAPAVLLRTPHGQRLLIAAGTDTDTLERSLLSRLPPWDRHLDLVIGDEALNTWGRRHRATFLPINGHGSRSAQADGSQITWLAGNCWLLHYGDLHLLLPTLPPATGQSAIAQQLRGYPLTLLLAPARNSWPEPLLLAASRPDVVFVPQEATFPPGTKRQLRYSRQISLWPGQAVEIVSDGHTWQYRLQTTASPDRR